MGHHPEVGQHLENMQDKHDHNPKAPNAVFNRLMNFTMSLHIVMKVLLKRMQNCVNVLVAKLCFSRVPVSCGENQWEQELIYAIDADTIIRERKTLTLCLMLYYVVTKSFPGPNNKRIQILSVFYIVWEEFPGAGCENVSIDLFCPSDIPCIGSWKMAFWVEAKKSMQMAHRVWIIF